MSRKMLKEEKELRGFIIPLDIEQNPGFYRRKHYRRYCRLITALVRAVRADERDKITDMIASQCKGITLENSACRLCGSIIDAIREGK